jgi:parvulin-like peptidyl-prolyl isomerase
MSPVGKFTLRLGIYGAVFVYLVCDLHFCQGPLSRKLRNTDPNSPEAVARAREAGIVAVVYGNPLDRRQLDRAVAERLWAEGRKPADLTPQTRKLVRYAALDDLIDHELLRMKVKVNAESFKLTPDEIDVRYQRFVARFATPDELSAALAEQGLGSAADLRERLAGRMQQERYVESRIGPKAVVGEDEARKWFEEHRESLAVPERIEVRQVFLATLERPAEEARAVLDKALAALRDKSKDFATLARELSEDPASKDRGGALGWMTRGRLPADFAEPVFALPVNEPALVRTKLGWHLIEVTARKPAEPRTFESAKAEVIAALEADKRRAVIAAFRTELRRMESRAITIYRDVVEMGLAETPVK